MSGGVEEKGLVKEPPPSAPLTTEGGCHVSSGGKHHLYPPAEGRYEDVVADAKLFVETLERLHLTLGTKFMVPTVGGKELDLHKLFVEVTSRGGIEKVIKDRRWKEITAVFSFPSTATNASFVLRKYYVSLLHHYEQIYFFGAKGWSSVPAASTNQDPDRSIEHLMSATETPVIGVKRKKNTSEFLAGVNISTQKSYQVVGIIDAKFDHGYLATVWVGGQKLQGVLYHVHEKSAAQSVKGGVGSVVTGTRRRRKRRKLSKLDPTHPKPNRSGYNFFFAEQHARLKPLHPGKDREISRMIGELWNKLTETEKAVYQEIGLKDKERYKSEMVIYRERQKAGQVISTVLPIRQHPVELKAAIPEALPQDNGLKPKVEVGNSHSSLETESGSSTESDSDIEAALPAPEIGTDSAGMVEEPRTEITDFELRRRDILEMETNHLPNSSDKDPEVKKEELSVPLN